MIFTTRRRDWRAQFQKVKNMNMLKEVVKLFLSFSFISAFVSRLQLSTSVGTC